MRLEVEITVQHLETATGEILAKQTHYIDADDFGEDTLANEMISVFDVPVYRIASTGRPRTVTVRVEATFDGCALERLSCDRWVR